MENQQSRPLPPCPICGGTEFIKGYMQMLGGFVPYVQTGARRFFSLPEKPRTSKCRTCGLMLQFGQPEPAPKTPASN